MILRSLDANWTNHLLKLESKKVHAHYANLNVIVLEIRYVKATEKIVETHDTEGRGSTLALKQNMPTQNKVGKGLHTKQTIDRFSCTWERRANKIFKSPS